MTLALRLSPVRAAIFDLDGILIDSEPHWRAVEMAVFAEMGITLDEDLCRQTMGMRVDEVVAHWYQRSPWSNPSPRQVLERIVEAVGQRLMRHGVALPGACQLVRELAARGLPLAVASSSPTGLIELALERLALAEYFSIRRSAMDERLGKPHPDVFLTAAKALGVAPEQCIVFEDSVAGVQAACAAGMSVVAVPDLAEWDHPGFSHANARFRSLAEVPIDAFLGPKRLLED